jgi:hypothetical protein
MMTLIPAVFRRAGSSKLVGCLVYLVAAPFVALFLALFLSVPLMFALEALGLSRESASVPFLFLLPSCGVGVAVWGYRDFRRRAALEVVIDRDRVTIDLDGRRTVLRFEDVASIRLVPARIDFACVLISPGRVVRLPPEVAPFGLVRDPLDATLIPELVGRLDERIARDGAVTIRAPATRLVVSMCRAIGALLLGLLSLANPWWFFMGILVVRHAAVVYRQSLLRLRGGLVIEREGLRHPSDAAAIAAPWDRLERVRSDPIGLVLRSAEGRTFALTPLADDFWPALRWINTRLK